MSDFSTMFWLLWGVMFLIGEVPALFNKAQGDTLSEHLRAWFATKNKPTLWILRRGALALFFIWFIIHLFVDGPGPL